MDLRSANNTCIKISVHCRVFPASVLISLIAMTNFPVSVFLETNNKQVVEKSYYSYAVIAN